MKLTHAAAAGCVLGFGVLAACGTRTSATSADSFAADFAAESSGVVEVDAKLCGGDVSQGTGFLVASDTVVTAAHVVAGEASLTVTDPTTHTDVTARLIGIDTTSDVALMRIDTALAGHVFAFATGQPSVGARTAAIGYPLGGPESISEGAISGLDRTITVGDRPLVGMVQTDVPFDPGDSGGPLIDTSGRVDGIVDAQVRNAQGIGYAIPAATAQALVAAWERSPETIAAVRCPATAPQSPTSPPSTSAPEPAPTPGPSTPSPSTPSPSTPDRGAEAVAAVGLFLHLIDTHDYPDAYAMYTPANMARVGDEPTWARGLSHETAAFAAPRLVTVRSDGVVIVEVTFHTYQDRQYSPDHQECDAWDLDYHVVPWPDGTWRIDSTPAHGGGSGYAPC